MLNASSKPHGVQGRIGLICSLSLIPKLLTALCLNDEGVLFRAHEGEGGKWKHVSLKTCHVCQAVKVGIEEHDDSFCSLPSVY